MNVKKDDDGEIVLESEDHSISFSFNRQITPEDKNMARFGTGLERVLHKWARFTPT